MVSDTDEPLGLVLAGRALRQGPTAMHNSATAGQELAAARMRYYELLGSSSMTLAETPNGSRMECLTPLLGPDLRPFEGSSEHGIPY